jgi:polyhydroxyalkanoate synthesis regulator protein
VGGQPFSPEMWTQFMNVQGPMMQGMMNNYIDQSKSLFVQMQEQMQNQSKNLFGTFPFAPVPPTPTDKSNFLRARSADGTAPTATVPFS